MATGCEALLLIPLLLMTDAAVGEDVKTTDSIVSIYLFVGVHEDEK